MLWLFLNRPDIAGRRLSSMVEDFASGTPGYEFVLSLEDALDLYGFGHGVGDICRKITDGFEANYPDIMMHFGNWEWGRDGLYHQASDLCPFPLVKGNN